MLVLRSKYSLKLQHSIKRQRLETDSEKKNCHKTRILPCEKWRLRHFFVQKIRKEKEKKKCLFGCVVDVLFCYISTLRLLPPQGGIALKLLRQRWFSDGTFLRSNSSSSSLSLSLSLCVWVCECVSV